MGKGSTGVFYTIFIFATFLCLKFFPVKRFFFLKKDSMLINHYLYFSSHKCGDIVLIFKDGKCLQQILLKPFPVFGYFFSGTTCTNVK